MTLKYAHTLYQCWMLLPQITSDYFRFHFFANQFRKQICLCAFTEQQKSLNAWIAWIRKISSMLQKCQINTLERHFIKLQFKQNIYWQFIVHSVIIDVWMRASTNVLFIIIINNVICKICINCCTNCWQSCTAMI